MSGVIFAGMGQLGDPTGIPVVLSDLFYDGEMYVIEDFGILRGSAVVIGTRPIDATEWCRREALMRVHAGLADVLRWIGEPPYRAPRPHGELLKALAIGATERPRVMEP